MQMTTLGRTGLKVSVAALGCGGNSRIGLGTGASRSDAVALVRRALDLGVNLFDTAEAYGTEEVLGEALAGVPRERFVVSTKSRYRVDGALLDPPQVVANLERSLRRLGLDHVDVFHVHAVRPADYDTVRERLVPVLLEARDAGKFAHLGITETPPNDPEQTVMGRAVDDGVWEVAMLAYHMMNQRPREAILPAARGAGIGTMIMFAVRNIFSRPERLRRALAELAERGAIAHDIADGDALGFLTDGKGAAASLTEAAYRFARHAAGVDTVLFGTGSPTHLEANVAALNAPPLPEARHDACTSCSAT